jgi:hypothetical protein
MKKLIDIKDCCRMKKKLLFVLTVALFPLVMIFYAFAQEDMKFVDTDAFENPRRPPAVFRHDEHNELAKIEECMVCHHVYDENGRLVEDESSEDQRCSDCHELEASGRQPALMKAFHSNCKGCHKVKKDGPVMCGQCHVRSPASID